MKKRKDILVAILYCIVRYQNGGRGSAYVLAQYFNSIKCVFICINLNLLFFSVGRFYYDKSTKNTIQIFT